MDEKTWTTAKIDTAFAGRARVMAGVETALAWAREASMADAQQFRDVKGTMIEQIALMSRVEFIALCRYVANGAQSYVMSEFNCGGFDNMLRGALAAEEAENVTDGEDDPIPHGGGVPE